MSCVAMGHLHCRRVRSYGVLEYGEGRTYEYDDYGPVGCDVAYTKLHNRKDGGPARGGAVG